MNVSLDYLDGETGRKLANPYALAVNEYVVHKMTTSSSRNGFSGSADKLPEVYRTGCMDALNIPSRIGDSLHYRDGRVESTQHALSNPAQSDASKYRESFDKKGDSK